MTASNGQLIRLEKVSKIFTTDEVETHAPAGVDLLGKLHAAGSTICMVTQDPRYAGCAELAIQMFDGRIVEKSVPAG